MAIQKKRPLRILFIGNSHTFYNDMPMMVKRWAEDAGYSCHVTMLAHGGWYLAQHAEEADVQFNILYLKETVFPCMDKDFRLHFNWG